MAQTTSLVFNGGVIPSPTPGTSGSGKAKLLKIGEITVTEQEVQVTKNVICDPDSITTVAPFMEVLTSAKLAELISANSILVLDDGTVQYLMADATVVVEDGTSVCTSVSFLGLSLEDRAKVLYPCTRITDELTLQQVLEVGEPVETGFDFVKAYPEDTEAGTLIDKLMVEDTVQGPDDQPLLEVVPSEDGEGHAKAAINEDNLREAILGINNSIDGIIETIDEMDVNSVPRAYLASTLNQSPGDNVSTRTTIDVFSVTAIEGGCFEFEQTTVIDDTPFGYVWIEPGTYLINAAVTLQWVGNPRGTFVAKVGSVMGENFDFSQEQEISRQSTKVVTIPNRMKLAVNVTYDAGTPVMGFWIQSMQVVKLTGGMSQTTVAHGLSLEGNGSVENPLGISEHGLFEAFNYAKNKAYFATKQELDTLATNVDIASPNNTITVTATTDPQTNTKTFDIDVANGGNSCGWFNSSNIDTVGSEEIINVDRFRVSEGQSVIGNGLEFMPIPGDVESGVPFGKVYANDGIYFVSVRLILLWTGNPVNKICNVAGRPFDFSYNHEEKVITTNLMRFRSRTKMSVNISLESDIPAGLRIWVDRFQIFAINAGTLEIQGIEAVEHDGTLTGSGTEESPLSIQSALDVSNANTAPEYEPTVTYPTVGTLRYHENVLYKSIIAINTAEDWNPAHWTTTSVDEQIGNVEALLAAL